MGDDLYVFYVFNYLTDLKASLQKANEEVATIVYNRIRANLESINFKDNPVKLISGFSVKEDQVKAAGKIVTSDAKRKHEVMESIVKDRIQTKGNSVIGHRIGYTVQNFEDSHIGIYYEHGTGTNWDGINERVTTEGRSHNDYREGRQIVSRSKHINYQGLGKGVWIDLGGNMRITGSRKAGEADAGFMSYIGEETKAYHWFSLALSQCKDDVRQIYREAINRVNIFDKHYWKYKKKFKLGVD